MAGFLFRELASAPRELRVGNVSGTQRGAVSRASVSTTRRSDVNFSDKLVTSFSLRPPRCLVTFAPTFSFPTPQISGTILTPAGARILGRIFYALLSDLRTGCFWILKWGSPKRMSKSGHAKVAPDDVQVFRGSWGASDFTSSD